MMLKTTVAIAIVSAFVGPASIASAQNVDLQLRNRDRAYYSGPNVGWRSDLNAQASALGRYPARSYYQQHYDAQIHAH